MALLRTKQLAWHQQAAGGASETAYVVPSGYRAVVRDVRIMNRTGSAATEVVVGFSASGGTPFTAVFDGAIPDASVASVAGEIVLEAGDNFICFATLANITYLFSGALLTLPA